MNCDYMICTYDMSNGQYNLARVEGGGWDGRGDHGDWVGGGRALYICFKLCYFFSLHIARFLNLLHIFQISE